MCWILLLIRCLVQGLGPWWWPCGWFSARLRWSGGRDWPVGRWSVGRWSGRSACFGFVEGGFQPAPQAPVSVLTEVAILALLAVPIVDLPRIHQAA
jgi:hypothetical protein